MLTERQASSTGLGQASSAWQLRQPSAVLSTAATYTLLALPPTNVAAGVASADVFPGTALAAATTSVAAGSLNAPIGLLAGVWIWLPSTGNTGTIAVQVVNGDTQPTTAVTTTLVTAAASSALGVGWNSLVLASPADRRPVVDGTSRTNLVQLFPGDLVQLVVATATLPAGTLALLDTN